jgi:hypothetical protein
MMGEMAEREPGEQQRIKLSETLNIYDVLILGIELPTVVSNAINRKIEQYYISEEYKFRVERERRESERKQIEAVGIRNFQQTVSQGISESYLRWRGIEATLQLAQSTNTKVVIVGGGKDGLPIILGNVDSSPAAPPATSPERETPPKEKPTAAGPAKPVEKTPASGLTAPSEKTPTASNINQPESTTASAPPLVPPSFSWPPSLKDFEALLQRAMRPSVNDRVEQQREVDPQRQQ